MPAFSSPIDCTPWVIGGLWPAELSTVTDETATLAEYLKADLQRIIGSANDELKIIKRAGMADAARQAEEARVIDEARANAVRRVESTIRHLRTMKTEVHAEHPRMQVAERFPGTDIDETQVIPAVTAVEPAADEPTGTAPEPLESTQSDRQDAPVAGPSADDDDEPEASEAGHRAAADDAAAETATTPEPEAPEAPAAAVQAESDSERLLLAFVDPASTVPEPQESTDSDRQDAPAVDPVADPLADDDESEASDGRHRAPADDGAARAVITPEPEASEAPAPIVEADSERLQRLLAFVVRQEPRLNWAVGDHADGTTVLVTDLAHGWIPPGITLPAGVRLLEPGRRTGKVSALVGETTRAATYTPGDPVGRSADFAATEPSVQARELPVVEDLGWELGRITHWRDGLPRLVHTLAKAAAAGTGVVEEEADLLRVHLDTARYQVQIQYPDVEPALLLNCLLLAATESSVAGDLISANYHLAWFQKLDEPPASQWTTKP
jgi:hypothetical protein